LFFKYRAQELKASPSLLSVVELPPRPLDRDDPAPRSVIGELSRDLRAWEERLRARSLLP